MRAFLLFFLFATQIAFSQWENCSAEIFGGEIKAIYAHNNKLYAGNDRGLFISSDEGGAWRYIPLRQFAQIKSIVAIEEKIVLGTEYGIYYSTDEGENWAQIEVGLPTNIVNSIVETDNIIYAATSNGLFRSGSLNDDWAQITTDLPQGNVHSLAVLDSILFVNLSGQNFGYYRSTDYGSSWSKIKIDTITSNFTALSVDKGIIFATDGINVFYSNNKGLQFDPSISIPNFNSSISSIAADSNKALIGAYDGVYIYDHTHKSFMQPIEDAVISRVAIIDGIYYAAGNNVVYKSVDRGKTWESGSKQNINRFTYTLASNDSLILTGNTGGLFISWDNGTSWLNRSRDLGNNQIIKIASQGERIIALTQSDSVFYSTNLGVSWEAATNVFPNHLGENYIRALAVNDLDFYVGSAFGVYVSTDNGTTWHKRPLGFQYEDVRALALKGDSLYAGTIDHGVWLTTDKGLTWTSKNEGLVESPVYDIAISGNNFTLAGFNCAYYSNDFGDLWIRRDLPENYSTDIEKIAIKGDTILTSTGNGLIISTNAGHNWKVINGNINFHYMTDLAISGHYMFVSDAQGVFRAKLSDLELLSVDSPKALERTFEVYPNPFNDRMTVSYSLSEANYVSIEMFDIQGNKIANLVNEFQAVGVHEADYLNKGLAPGCYYIRLQAGGLNITEKVIVID